MSKNIKQKPNRQSLFNTVKQFIALDDEKEHEEVAETQTLADAEQVDDRVEPTESVEAIDVVADVEMPAKKAVKRVKPIKKRTAKRPFIYRELRPLEKTLLLVLLGAFIVSGYFISPMSRVAAITVAGNNDVTEQDIVSQSGVVSGELLLSVLLGKQHIAQQLEHNLAKIEQADVTIDQDNTVVINVKEYDVIAYVLQAERYYTILANGVVLEENNSKYLGTVPLVNWQGSLEELQIFAKDLSKLNQEIRQSISEIVYTQETDKLLTTLYMNDGNQVKLNYTRFAEKMQYYESMKNSLEGKRGVIDLTVGAYFTPYP